MSSEPESQPGAAVAGTMLPDADERSKLIAADPGRAPLRARLRARWRRVFATNVRWRGELLRQSWLYALAVLGPFVLLGLFAVGFRFAAFRPTGILVTPPGSPDAATIAHLSYVKGLSANITIRSITTDEQQALDSLRAEQVDMVIVLPSSPAEDLAHGERAQFSIYVSVVNPLLRIALYNAVNQQIAGVNDEAIAAAVAVVQDQTRSFQPQLESLNTSLQAIKPTDPPDQVETQLGSVETQLEQIRAQAASSAAAQQGTAADIYYAALISETDQAITSVQQAEVQVAERHGVSSSLLSAQASVKSLNDFVQQLEAIPARTVAIPFTATITNLAAGGDDLANFFGPAALALLLEHLAITLAALSLVQERELGAVETLAVSPASAAEILFGRFVFYGGVTFVTGIMLTALLVLGLHVPFVGSVLPYLAIVALLIWASTAAGFCLALVTSSAAQAMQSIMLVLVGAIFFSGFVGPLRALALPVVALAYVFPLTYGINGLDSVMLLGTTPSLVQFAGLGTIAAVLSVAAWLLMRRELAPK
jgi:ABC-2 type transport system permease protein